MSSKTENESLYALVQLALNESEYGTHKMVTEVGKGGNFMSPLRYPGGKGRLGPWLAQLMSKNKIDGGRYLEPYAGGAGAAIYLLARRHVDHIVINDLDPVVYAFWWAILNDSEAFLELVERTPVTMDGWYKQKEVHADPGSFSLTEIGFSTFFLNRTNRSGILKGGVIGGKRQDGPYSLSARFNKDDLTFRIRNVVAMAKKISLFNEDAVQLLSILRSDLHSKSLIYFDPPYYRKGSQLYRNHYLPEDHQKIANAIKGIETPWLVTYDNCDEIKELYAGCQSAEFSLHYSTSKGRPLATELMFFGNLKMTDEGPMMTRRLT